VQVVGYDGTGHVAYYRLPLDEKFDGAVNGSVLSHRISKFATVVGAIVMQDDPTESTSQYARYTLKANGVTQLGG
jgi:hypothetical protein